MKKHETAYMLESLHVLAEKCNAEINITPDGISLWTSDSSGFTCQDVSGTKAVKALNAFYEFNQYWWLND